jgi:phage-related protein
MPKIDRLDEAIIDSPPMLVYKAILNEYAGVTHWWMPYLARAQHTLTSSETARRKVIGCNLH